MWFCFAVFVDVVLELDARFGFDWLCICCCFYFAVVVDAWRLKLMFGYALIDYVKLVCVYVLPLLLMIGVCI